MTRVALLLIGALAAVAARAEEEFYILGGATLDRAAREASYAYSLEYVHGFGENVYATFSYLNEGHTSEHHRDGHTTQLWRRFNVLERRLSLAVGIGPYRYFDTKLASKGASYSDDHGWGLIYSAGAIWYTDSRWLAHLRANFTSTSHSINTTTLLLGVGYQLDAPRGQVDLTPAFTGKTTENEVTLFVGRSILNSAHSEGAAAASVEYRRGLSQYIDWTAGWIYEGDSFVVRRNGVTTQLWLVRSYLDQRLALGIGFGGYFVVDHRNGEDIHRAAGLTTLSASYRFDFGWTARLSFNRLITAYNRDSDVILLGVGYRF